jgi:hypothetical protein
MRILLVGFCALLTITLSLEAKKKLPPSQNTTISKQHRDMVKKIQKSRKAPKTKHRQRVN